MSACIDSGGSDDTDTAGGGDGGGPATVERISFSGLVADGYLAGAKVCLDLNNNKECDVDEPSTTSVTGGTFEIDDATQEQRDTYPLLVEVVVGTTVDEDTITDAAPNGVAFDKPLTLTAPVGYEFISPLTTMVQNEVEGGASASDAETAVQEKLGTTLDLDSDYIAGKTGANADEYEQLHQVAQVTAIVISDNLVKLEDAAQENNISLDDLISAIVDEVFAALDEITEQVEEIAADDEQTFDPGAVATEVDEELVDLEPDTIDEVVDLNNAQDDAVEANLASVIKAGGISWFYTEFDEGTFEAEYGTLSVDGSDVLQDISYDWNGSDFVLDESTGDDDPGYILLNGTWTAAANIDDPSSITTNEDGSIELVQADGNYIQKFKGSEVDLAGKNARLLMNGVDDGEGIWGEYLAADLVFPADSKGYTLTDNGSDEPYIFESYTGCEVSQEKGDLCSYAYVQDGPGGLSGAMTSLADITVASAAQVAGSVATALPVLKAVEIAYGENDKVWAEIVEGGVVNYYLVAYDHQSYSFLGASTWMAVSGAESTTIELEPIAAITNYDSEFDDGDKPVLAVIAGFVRNAVHIQNNAEVTDQVQLLNSTARDAVIPPSFSPDNLALALTAPCVTGNSNGILKTFAEYETAITACLAGNPENAYAVSQLQDAVSNSVLQDTRTTFLTNGKGIFTPEGTWFDWSINSDDRLVFEFNNVNNEAVTITVAKIIASAEQAYVQTKSFLQNPVAFGGDSGLIGVNAFEVSPLDPADLPVPFALIDGTTFAGAYTLSDPAGVEGDSTFIFNDNGTGSAHFPPDPEDVAANSEHPGYDDDLTWMVDAAGRLVVNFFSISDGEFFGVDRYTLASGNQTTGTMKIETINDFGRYQLLGTFNWVRTGDAPMGLCSLGNVSGTVAGGDLPTNTDFANAVSACLGNNSLVPFTAADLVDTTLTEKNIDDDSTIGVYTFDGWDNSTSSLRGNYHSAINITDEVFSWGLEEDANGDTTGVLIISYDNLDDDRIAMLSFDSTTNKAELKVRAYRPTNNNSAEIYSRQVVKVNVQARSTLANLAGVYDDFGYDDNDAIVDLAYLVFLGSEFILYDYQDDTDGSGATCYNKATLAITDQNDGQFRIVGDPGDGVIDVVTRFYKSGSYLYDDEGESAVSTKTQAEFEAALCQ
mgnify:FL=1